MTSPAQAVATEASRAPGTAARILLLLTGSMWFLLAAFVDLPGRWGWLALYAALMVLVWRLWRRAGGLYLSWLPTREYDAGLAGEV